MRLFTEPRERAKAMGVFGFVASGGGSLGVVPGGVHERPPDPEPHHDLR